MHSLPHVCVCVCGMVITRVEGGLPEVKRLINRRQSDDSQARGRLLTPFARVGVRSHFPSARLPKHPLSLSFCLPPFYTKHLEERRRGASLFGGGRPSL